MCSLLIRMLKLHKTEFRAVFFSVIYIDWWMDSVIVIDVGSEIIELSLNIGDSVLFTLLLKKKEWSHFPPTMN